MTEQSDRIIANLSDKLGELQRENTRLSSRVSELQAELEQERKWHYEQADAAHALKQENTRLQVEVERLTALEAELRHLVDVNGDHWRAAEKAVEQAFDGPIEDALVDAADAILRSHGRDQKAGCCVSMIDCIRRIHNVRESLAAEPGRAEPRRASEAVSAEKP